MWYVHVMHLHLLHKYTRKYCISMVCFQLFISWIVAYGNSFLGSFKFKSHLIKVESLTLHRSIKNILHKRQMNVVCIIFTFTSYFSV